MRNRRKFQKWKKNLDRIMAGNILYPFCTLELKLKMFYDGLTLGEAEQKLKQ